MWRTFRSRVCHEIHKENQDIRDRCGSIFHSAFFSKSGQRMDHTSIKSESHASNREMEHKAAEDCPRMALYPIWCSPLAFEADRQGRTAMKFNKNKIRVRFYSGCSYVIAVDRELIEYFRKPENGGVGCVLGSAILVRSTKSTLSGMYVISNTVQTVLDCGEPGGYKKLR